MPVIGLRVFAEDTINRRADRVYDKRQNDR